MSYVLCLNRADIDIVGNVHVVPSHKSTNRTPTRELPGKDTFSHTKQMSHTKKILLAKNQEQRTGLSGPDHDKFPSRQARRIWLVFRRIEIRPIHAGRAPQSA
jgi:hypothetical protein